MCFVKHVVRYGVITALVGGTAALVAGPDRVHALITQTRQHVNSAIDAQIDDPIALRSQMRQLAGTYPERIASVERDLAELHSQQAQLKQESVVSDRVVALANADLDQMKGLLDKAQATQTSLAADNHAAIVRVVFNNESLDVNGAYAKARSIQQVRDAYTTRANDIQRDLGYLGQQEERLTKLQAQLQQENADFQAQLWQMDRQVDSIARNDRLISMMEKRQKTLDDQGRYGADSLQQLSGRFADIRAKQEARLQTLGTGTAINNYEDRAKLELDAQRAYNPGVFDKPAAPITPSVIEITPDSPAAHTTSVQGNAQPKTLASKVQ